MQAKQRNAKSEELVQRSFRLLRDPQADTILRLIALDCLVGRRDLDDHERASRDAYVPVLARLVEAAGEVVTQQVIYSTDGRGRITRRLPI